MATSVEGPKISMAPLFDLVLAHVAPPQVEDGPFRMLGTILEANPYLGRLVTGRISAGSIKPNQPAKVLDRHGALIEQGRVSKVLAFRGLERQPIDEAFAGDIVSLAGLPEATVSHTICAPEVTTPLPAQPIDPPTLSMTFRINDSPLAGTEGDKVQSRVIRDRLLREAEGNVALRISELPEKDAMEVAGRGELQLGILIETMRREGFELSVSRPKVLFERDPETAALLEPIEEVVIDVDEEFAGVVVQKLSERKGEMIEMRPSGGGRVRLVFYAPTRGLIGYQGELLTDSRGTAVMNRLFHGYAPHKGDIQGRRTGVLLSNDQGEAVAYALWNLEDRGPMMIEPGWKVYRGMIVGEHTRGNDLDRQRAQGQKTHQYPHHGEGRGGAPHAADPHDAGKGARLYRGRRARRGDPEIDPAAQAHPRPQRPQEGRAPARGGGGVTSLSDRNRLVQCCTGIGSVERFRSSPRKAGTQDVVGKLDSRFSPE